MWKGRRLTDKSQILAYLEADRAYAAYAIGDLEPGLYEQCSWLGAERDGVLESLALCYHGMTPPAFFLMGTTHGLRVALAEQFWPHRVYFTCLQEHLPVTQEFFAWDRVVFMWRMVLDPSRFQASKSDCVRLGPANVDQLLRLYSLGGADAFSTYQLQQGVFYGVRVRGSLVAAAGTHLVSPTYGVAAVGNVFTHPECRGRGYGAATTAAVVHDLLQYGIGDIVLNVDQSNAAAIRLYERIGFERYCPFLEGRATSLIGESQRSEPGRA